MDRDAAFQRWNDIQIRYGQYGIQDCAAIREVILEDTYNIASRPNGHPGEVVFDIGAHIGCFAIHWRAKNPEAQITCVEVAPENIAVLRANVGSFARIHQAACTYEAGKHVRLLNSIKENGITTGGSVVVNDSNPSFDSGYWLDDRRIRCFTLEELMAESEVDRIDVLKLDCEGSEFSILENCSCLDKIGFICGEYHDARRWNELIANRFPNWGYALGAVAGPLGIFHLQNPHWNMEY